MNDISHNSEGKKIMFEFQGQEMAHAHPEAIHGGSLHPRLAWMICYQETGNVPTVCSKFGISRKTFYKWLKRFQKSGGDSASLTDQSRRPHHFPRATPESSVALLKQLRAETGYGQRRLKTCLLERHNISLSERTIWKILKRTDQDSNGKGKAGAQVYYLPVSG